MRRKRKWLCRIISRRWLVCYLVILGMTALWANRTEIVLASIVLLTPRVRKRFREDSETAYRRGRIYPDAVCSRELFGEDDEVIT